MMSLFTTVYDLITLMSQLILIVSKGIDSTAEILSRLRIWPIFTICIFFNLETKTHVPMPVIKKTIYRDTEMDNIKF